MEGTVITAESSTVKGLVDDLKPGERLSVSKEAIPSSDRLFIKLGRKSKHKKNSMNAIQLMVDFSNNEYFCLLTILDNMVYDYITRREVSLVNIAFNQNNPKRTKFSRGFKLLEKKDIVKRICKQHYMINPNFIVPRDEEFWDPLWDSPNLIINQEYAYYLHRCKKDLNEN